MEKVFVPASSAESEFTEKKSRFISIVQPVSSPEEIKEIIRNARRTHPQSRHVVWAYILGDSRSIFGLSDDGEPHGTAGKPVLEVLKGSGLTDVLVLVVRYFGGVKLGTGGLVSAYTRSAQDVLRKISLLEKIPKTRFCLSYPYNFHDQIKKAISEEDGSIIEESYETAIAVKIEIPDAKKDCCSRKIQDITSGSVDLIECE